MGIYNFVDVYGVGNDALNFLSVADVVVSLIPEKKVLIRNFINF